MHEKDAAEKFNRSAPYYDKSYAKWDVYPKLINRIIELADPTESDVVLDIGTGTGALALKIAPKVKKVFAIDVSEKMLGIAKEKAMKEGFKNIEFRIGSFSEPNVNDKVDIIISNLSFEYVPDNQKRLSLKKMFDLLNVSGKIILGERMLFFDPKKEPEKAKRILNDLIFQATGKSLAEFEKEVDIKSITTKYQAQINQVIEDHKEIKFKAENVKSLFEEAGFKVEKVEAVQSIFGIIYAKKTS